MDRPVFPAGVSLRTITAADDAFVREVYAGTRDAEMAMVDWHDAAKQQFLDMQWRAQSMHYDTNHPGADRCLILVDGVPAGRLYVDRTTEQIHLLDIALLAPHRSQGIGTRLLLDLMDEARREHRALRCHVERFNRAWGLYQRLGFRPIADAGMYAYLEWIPDFERLRADVLADDALQSQLREPAAGGDDFVQRVVAMSAARGLQVSADDVNTEIAGSRRAWIERWIG
ncbi:MAG TPA: GNAT family N-acetyltransferase [Candidatus Dormibacteraeota bacterium]|nr:GNAT family N-acetyltransferase [Candidatus Dormibacteraeota bacterium]